MKWLQVVKDILFLGIGVAREVSKVRKQAKQGEPAAIPKNELENFDEKVNREVRGLWQNEAKKKGQN